jgi:uncharacterized membrane protein YoaT (DUF817 family)
MNLNAWCKARVADMDAAVRPWSERAPWRGHAYEFLLFGLKQAWASLFAGSMLGLILLTGLFWPHGAPVARYDFLVVAAVLIQAALLALKLERWDEALVILVYHLVGTAMEVFKTAHGSWTYPEPSLLRIGGVPLFSGFMYAAIGSYIARAWRLFDIRFTRHPPLWTAWALAVAAYVNFFSHHYLPDIRLGLFVLSALLFGRTGFVFTPDKTPRRMPMILGLVLVALFIWVAENLGTFAAAWTYPSQHAGWRLVPLTKLGAWYLLILLSYVLVTLIHRPQPMEKGRPSQAAPSQVSRFPFPAWRGRRAV